MNKLNTVICAVPLIVLATMTAYAQGTTTTPTPAPSKTATLAVSTPAATMESLSEATPNVSTSFDSLTQADLTRLTGNVQRPNGLAWFEGKLYTACSGDGTVYEIDGTTGETRTLIYGVKNAQSLYVETDDADNLTLWVPDYAGNVFSKVTRGGVETVVADLQAPWGVAYVDEEQFLVTSLLGNNIHLISREGDDQVVLEDLSSPAGIVHDGETVFVANYGSTRRSIEWYSLDSLVNGASDDAESHLLVSGLQNTTGLQLGADGMLYFAYALGNRGMVGRVDPQVCRENGGCTNEQVEIVLYSDLSAPLAGLTLTPDMRMYVHTMFVPDLYWAELDN